MDFAKLDLRSAGEAEYWIDLRLGDTYLFADMKAQEGPCRVKVASPASEGVEVCIKAVQRSALRMQTLSSRHAAAGRDERRALESQLDACEKECSKVIKDFLTTAIRGWENIQKDGKPLEFSIDVLADMSEPKAPFARLATFIAEDMAKVVDPFTEAAVD